MLKGSGRAVVSSSAKAFVSHCPFDMVPCENIFQRVKAPPDEKHIVEALMVRAETLRPSENEQSLLEDLVAKVKGLLEGFSFVTTTFETVTVDEVHVVGSYRMGTLMIGRCIADIVIVLKSLPTIETIYQIAQKVTSNLLVSFPGEQYGCNRSERGAEICNSSEASVRILPACATLVSHDPKIHVERRFLQGHMMATRHAKWFDDNAAHENVKILVRLIRDMKNRFEGLSALNPWLICLLAQYSVMNNPDRQALAINVAFKRCLQLLAAGLFLPNSAGISDPCVPGGVRTHLVLSNQQQDQICYTAQTLLRIYNHGGYRNVIGFELHPDIIASVTAWNGTIVTPSDRAYEEREVDMEQEN